MATLQAIRPRPLTHPWPPRAPLGPHLLQTSPFVSSFHPTAFVKWFHGQPRYGKPSDIAVDWGAAASTYATDYGEGVGFAAAPFAAFGCESGEGAGSRVAGLCVCLCGARPREGCGPLQLKGCAVVTPNVC